MKRITTLTAAAALLLTAPGLATADTPSSSSSSASQACKTERTKMGTQAFAQLYGTNKNRRNAFGKCVSKHEDQQAQNDKAAEEQCRTEQQADATAFANKYGTNKNKRNAFGKCVSQKSHEADAAASQETVNAAKACRTEQKADATAFANKYGTNKNKRNAFGKCVSQKAKAQQPSQSS